DDARAVGKFEVIAYEVANVVLGHEAGVQYVGTGRSRCIYSGYIKLLGPYRQHAWAGAVSEIALRRFQHGAVCQGDADGSIGPSMASTPYQVVFADETGHESVGGPFVEFVRAGILLNDAVVEYGDAVRHGQCFGLIMC